ncbi:MAG: signal recognition particle-docking protein FtsY [Acidimicrobiia bacterium]|nr:MAG: signal recognition particle-docking protein FtsY [Acidimicrobiia bacterium]
MTSDGAFSRLSTAFYGFPLTFLIMDSGVVTLAVVAVLAVVLIAVLLFRRKGSSEEVGQRAEVRVPESTSSLRVRLAKTRSALSSSLIGVFSNETLSEDVWAHLEDALISADVGPRTAADLVQRVREDKPANGGEARMYIIDELESMLADRDRSLHLDGSPAVVVVVGVNGSGKTTSIAKLAKGLVDDGMSVVLGAADTFRAAADAQLREWGERVGVAVVSGAEGMDPAAVAHDALTKARADSADVVIVDTAGRLHSQRNLMDELGKVVRIVDREADGIGEVLLVLDGTTGQNGIAQAEAFTHAVGVTGIVLTKLDGTSRGGIAIAVERQLGIPVKFIGIGEGMEDLIPFVPEDFVEALLAP